MYLATIHGFENIVLMLLDNGFGADAKDALGKTPLCWAALLGRTAIVNLLLSLNKNAAHWKKRDDGDELASGLLLNGKAVDVNLQDSIGTPLSWAADRGHFVVVANLLEQEDINPNLGTKDGRSPLACAANHGHEEVVRLLAAHADVDVNHGASSHDTALISAVKSRQEVVVKFLLSHPNIDVNAGAFAGITPLIIAARHDNAREAELLLRHPSIDVNCKDRDDGTALAMAIFWGHEAIVKLLLTCHGIDVNSKNKEGRTPLSIAGHPDRHKVNKGFRNCKAIVEPLLARDDIDLRCIDEDLLSRATKFAHEKSIPELEVVITLVREAIKNWSRASCED